MSADVDASDLFRSCIRAARQVALKAARALPHQRFFLGTVLSTIALKATEQDVKLQAIPQFHAGGYIYQLAHLAAGATIVGYLVSIEV